MTGAEGRAHYDKVLLENNPISIEVARSEDFDIPGPAGPIGARSYVPLGLDDSQPPAALVFYHGGGWVIGSIAQAAIRPAARWPRKVAASVYSVDYRLAPEHPFPAAVDDAYAAAVWLVDNAGELGVDPDRIALGDDSAGGNLAAVVTHLARDGGGPRFAFQLLIYPATDVLLALDLPSYALLRERHFITPELMAWYHKHYFATAPDPHRHPPLAGPRRRFP